MTERALPTAALALLTLFAQATARAPQNPVKEVGDGFKRMGETLSERMREVTPSRSREDSAPREPRWYTISGGEFTLDMPGEPQHSRTARPHAVDVYRLRAGSADYLLQVRRVRTARGSRVRALEGHALGYASQLAEESARRGGKADVTFERDLRVGGVPGKQYRVSAGGRGGVIRFFATASHIYTVQVLGAADTDATAAEFLNSFRVGAR